MVWKRLIRVPIHFHWLLFRLRRCKYDQPRFKFQGSRERGDQYFPEPLSWTSRTYRCFFAKVYNAWHVHKIVQEVLRQCAHPPHLDLLGIQAAYLCKDTGKDDSCRLRQVVHQEGSSHIYRWKRDPWEIWWSRRQCFLDEAQPAQPARMMLPHFVSNCLLALFYNICFPDDSYPQNTWLTNNSTQPRDHFSCTLPYVTLTIMHLFIGMMCIYHCKCTPYRNSKKLKCLRRNYNKNIAYLFYARRMCHRWWKLEPSGVTTLRHLI